MKTKIEGAFDSIEEAIRDIADGKMIIVTDDEDRENEGDLVIAASKVTPEAINMMVTHARGLICVPMIQEHLERLGINQMVPQNRESMKTAFTVSVDAARGITTGISAYERAETVRVLANPNSQPSDLVQPGHIFPLCAKPGGVLERAGHTEATVDLAKLAGLQPCAVICEILKDDGSMARLPDLIEYKKRFGLKLVSIADLIEYRNKREQLVKLITKLPFESEFGTFTLHVFENILDKRPQFALTMGTIGESPTLVRVHSENLLTDVFGGLHLGTGCIRCAMKRIATEGHGVILYLRKPQGGMSLNGKAKSISDLFVEQSGNLRDYGIGAQILKQLGLKKIRLISDTHRKLFDLDGYGLEIVEQV